MSLQPLISVIVITYNSSSTILETLDSIKRQTYSNIELVVSDDCSKDDTVKKAQNWILDNNINGIVVTTKKNAGIPANVNKGIKAAKGTLVKIIAGDDILYDYAIEKYYQYYLKDESVIWQARVSFFGVDEACIKRIEDSLPDYSFFELSNKEQYKALSVYNRIAAPALGLLNIKLFEQYGYYDETIPLIEDYPFNLKMSKNGISFRLIDEALVKYRISKGSVTGVASRRYYQSMKTFFFRYRFIAMLKNGCFFDLIKQTVRYIFLCFNIAIVKSESKYRFVKI